MPADNAEHGFKYWAFISYSHADKAWGDWLHRALETYRVPRRLVGTVSPSGERVPARVYPVFRDREELPVSASLPENINRALEQSRCLIVICSPRSAASRWVNEEIKTFKRLGREGHVLALIVAGEPNASEDGGKPGWRVEDECFPRALRYRWATDQGELSGERTEPIAADARLDKDGRRHAKLKLLAGLLGVNYDQLRQREHERRVRQLSYLVAATLALLAVFAGLAVYSEMQRRRAEQATATAREQEAEASRQRNTAVEANRQYQAQLHEASLSALATAQNLFGKGSWREGIAYLGRALKYDPLNQLASEWLWNEVVYGERNSDRLPPFLLVHQDGVTGVAYSPDGKRIVTASLDKTARQWDAATGQPIGEPMRHEKAVRCVAYSPDGTRIVTACGEIYEGPGYAQQWDAATGQPIGERLRHENDVYTIVYSAAYSADGTRIVTAAQDRMVRQWEAATGKRIGKLLDLGDFAFDAAYNPAGTRIVTANDHGDVQQWDASTGEPIGAPLHLGEKVYHAAYSPDGTRIVTACWDRTARQWDAATGQPIGSPLRHDKNVNSAAYSADCTRIVTACQDGSVRQWGADSCQLMGEPMLHEGEATSAAYNPDGTRIVAACVNGTARAWEAATGRPVGESIPSSSQRLGVSFHPDGTRMLTVDKNVGQQWDRATGKPVGGPLSYPAGVVGAAYNRDGTRIVAVYAGSTAQEWDAATVQPIGTPTRCEGRVICIADGPAGLRVVTDHGDNTTWQWDVATGKAVGVPLQPTWNVTGASYRRDGARIVTSCGDGTVQQWDAATGRAVGPPLHHEGWVSNAVFHPDGTRIVTTNGFTVWQWDAATGKPVGDPLRFSEPVVNAVYSPDGSSIVSVCQSGNLQPWDAATGQPIGEPFGCSSALPAILFSPDSAWLVTAGNTSATQWDCGYPVGPPPVWLDAFLSALSGLYFDAAGTLKSLPMLDRLVLKKSLDAPLGQAVASSDRWVPFARWTLASPPARSFTPNSRLSTRDFATRRLGQGDQGFDTNEVFALAPDTPLIHLALALLEKDAASADFLRRYDLRRLAPDDVALCIRAAAMLRYQEQPRLALETLVKTLAAEPKPGGDLLAALVLTRWLCGDKDGAVRDGQRLIAADAAYADAASVPAVAVLPDNDKAALLAAIAETLRLHPELAPKPGK